MSTDSIETVGEVDVDSNTVEYTSADKKLSIKICTGHIITAIFSFLTGFASGVYTMMKYDISKKS